MQLSILPMRRNDALKGPSVGRSEKPLPVRARLDAIDMPPNVRFEPGRRLMQLPVLRRPANRPRLRYVEPAEFLGLFLESPVRQEP
jgi:hypothetical protein